MSEITTTKRQRDLMAHAINLEDRLKERNRRKRRLRETEFRNYFCASVGGEDDAEITRLCGMGLMTKGPTINDGREYYAHVTPLGIKEVMP